MNSLAFVVFHSSSAPWDTTVILAGIRHCMGYLSERVFFTRASDKDFVSSTGKRLEWGSRLGGRHGGDDGAAWVTSAPAGRIVIKSLSTQVLSVS